jgi:hypothetical protein
MLFSEQLSSISEQLFGILRAQSGHAYLQCRFPKASVHWKWQDYFLTFCLNPEISSEILRTRTSSGNESSFRCSVLTCCMRSCRSTRMSFSYPEPFLTARSTERDEGLWPNPCQTGIWLATTKVIVLIPDIFFYHVFMVSGFGFDQSPSSQRVRKALGTRMPMCHHRSQGHSAAPDLHRFLGYT